MISVIQILKEIDNKMLKQQKLPTIGYNYALSMFIGTRLTLRIAINQCKTPKNTNNNNRNQNKRKTTLNKQTETTFVNKK